jgi:hypothetical protein
MVDVGSNRRMWCLLVADAAKRVYQIRVVVVCVVECAVSGDDVGKRRDGDGMFGSLDRWACLMADVEVEAGT